MGDPSAFFYSWMVSLRVVERMGDPSAARVDFVPGIVWGEKLFYIRREEAYRFIINISLQMHIIIYMTSLCACQQHDVIRMTSPLPPVHDITLPPLGKHNRSE